MNIRMLPRLLVLPLVAVASCSESVAPVTGVSSGPRATISDGAHGGNRHFFFLPPLVKAAHYSGMFDASLAPTVSICELDGNSCGAVLIEFTTENGPDSERVRLQPDSSHYLVNWHTDRFSLSTAKDYRIQVAASGIELGYANVRVVNRDLKNADTDELIQLLNGRTLPIKFRIEVGAVAESPEIPDTLELTFQLSSEYPLVHVNPADPISLTVPDAGAEVLQYWSLKNTVGTPLRLRAVSSRSLTEPAPLEYMLIDEQGTPRYYRNRHGSQMHVDLVSATRVRLRIVMPDGSETITFGDVNSAAAPAGASAGVRTWTAEDQRRVSEAYERRIGAELKEQPLGERISQLSDGTIGFVQAMIFAQAGAATAPITRALVTGYWELAREAEISPITVSTGAIYFPENSPTGTWLGEMSLAASSTSLEQFREMCRAAEENAGTVCAFLSTFETALEAACLLLLPHRPAAAVCDEALKFLKKVCDKGLGSCKLATKGIDVYIRRGSEVSISVAVGGYQLVDHVESKRQTYSPPIPNPVPFTFPVPLRATLTIDPPDPAPFQGYRATTELIPALAEIPVSISMWGTDGYSQSAGGPTDAAGRFFMDVPGAYEGVQDHITTNVLGITRSASIIF